MDKTAHEIEYLVKERRKNAMLIHEPIPSSMGGPPCKRCLASWRLSLMINKKKVEIKRLMKSKRILTDNHLKCSSCSILFGDCHTDSPASQTEKKELLCGYCSNLKRR